MSAPTPDPNFIPATDQGYGVLGIEISIIGCIISYALFGLSLMQNYSAFRLLFDIPKRQRKTNWNINFSLLLILLVVDIADSIIKGIYVITYTRDIILEGEIGLLNVPHTSVAVPLLDGFVAMVVQLIYVRRVYFLFPQKTWKLWIPTGVTILLAVLQFGFSIWASSVLLKPETDWAKELNTPLVIWMSLSPAADVIICMTFIYRLRTQRSAFSDTNNIIGDWIRFTLEIGLISTVLQLGTLILWVTMPFGAWYSLLAWVLSKVYINSVLVLFITILSGGINNSSNKKNLKITPGLASRSEFGQTLHGTPTYRATMDPRTPVSPRRQAPASPSPINFKQLEMEFSDRPFADAATPSIDVGLNRDVESSGSVNEKHGMGVGAAW